MADTILLRHLGMLPQGDSAYLDLYFLLSPNADWTAAAGRLAAHPSEAAVPSSEYCLLPLEIGLQNHDRPIPLGVVEALVDAYPPAVTVRAVETACGNPELSTEVVRFLLDREPSVVSKSDDPFYSAARGGHADVMRLLLERYPKSVLHSRSKYFGQLPLHQACQCEPCPVVVRLLLDAGREQKVGGKSGAGGLFEKDNDEKTPLDLAMESFRREVEDEWRSPAKTEFMWRSIILLLEAAGSSKMGRNDIGPYPVVHAAIEFGRRLDLIQEAITNNPGDLCMVDPFGKTPLLLAIEAWDDYTEVERRALFLALLSSEHRGCAALNIRDEKGRLPMDIATAKGPGVQHGLEAIFRENDVSLRNNCPTYNTDTKDQVLEPLIAETHDSSK